MTIEMDQAVNGHGGYAEGNKNRILLQSVFFLRADGCLVNIGHQIAPEFLKKTINGVDHNAFCPLLADEAAAAVSSDDAGPSNGMTRFD